MAVLFRGDSTTNPSLGRHSYWTTDDGLGTFFGPYMREDGEPLSLYRAEVDPSRLLDLRAPDPWGVLIAATGIDLRGGSAQRQNLINGRLDDLSAQGFDWIARYADYFENHREHRLGGIEEWIYLGTGTVDAEIIRELPDAWA